MPRIKELLEFDGETGRISPVSAETRRILEDQYRERVSEPAKKRAKRQRAGKAAVRNRPI